jgi:hypothetical protein
MRYFPESAPRRAEVPQVKAHAPSSGTDRELFGCRGTGPEPRGTASAARTAITGQ